MMTAKKRATSKASAKKAAAKKVARAGRGKRQQAVEPVGDLIDGLTDRERRFVREYGGAADGRQAAIRAGYPAPGAAAMASRLLKRPAIAAALAVQRDRIERRLELTRELVLERYRQIAFADLRDVYDDETGRLRAINELDDQTAAGLRGVEVVEMPDGPAVTSKIRWADQRAALDSIVRMQGWAIEPEVKTEGPKLGYDVRFTDE